MRTQEDRLETWQKKGQDYYTSVAYMISIMNVLCNGCTCRVDVIVFFSAFFPKRGSLLVF